MKDISKYIGLDISKALIAVAIAGSNQEAPRFYEAIPITPEAILKLNGYLRKDVQVNFPVWEFHV